MAWILVLWLQWHHREMCPLLACYHSACKITTAASTKTWTAQKQNEKDIGKPCHSVCLCVCVWCRVSCVLRWLADACRTLGHMWLCWLSPVLQSSQFSLCLFFFFFIIYKYLKPPKWQGGPNRTLLLFSPKLLHKGVFFFFWLKGIFFWSEIYLSIAVCV